MEEEEERGLKQVVFWIEIGIEVLLEAIRLVYGPWYHSLSWIAFVSLFTIFGISMLK